MNRLLGSGIAMFVAIVGIGLLGGNNTVHAGGCGWGLCGGGYSVGCGGGGHCCGGSFGCGLLSKCCGFKSCCHKSCCNPCGGNGVGGYSEGGVMVEEAPADDLQDPPVLDDAPEPSASLDRAPTAFRTVKFRR